MAGTASTIGRYEILREIGRGAMGVVYEAHDPALDRTVALKLIQPSAAEESVPVFEERFLAEARIAAALQHPGIVVVHDVGRDPATGVLFIALELVRGDTLSDLAAAGPVEWSTVVSLAAQVARALHYAHLRGVVHRDVKPANIVRLPTGEAKVMDFGIARLETARERLTTTGQFIGTPLYTSPEQAKTEAVDGRADVFSLASVAYTLLTGRAAFMAPTLPGIVHRVVYEEPPPLSSLVQGLPDDVEPVLGRALAKDPARRYPTAEAFAEDLEDLLARRPPRHAPGDDLVVVEEGSPGGRPEGRPDATRTVLPPSPRPRQRVPWVLVAAAGLLLVALFLWTPSRAPAPAPRAAAAATQPTSEPSVAAGGQVRGLLRIDLDHPLRAGTLRVFVDDERVLEEPLAGQKRTKALVFGLHEGSSRSELEVSPGLHEVRIEVRWDGNVRSERIVGSFRPGVTRRLEASLGRIRRDLDLEWK